MCIQGAYIAVEDYNNRSRSTKQNEFEECRMHTQTQEVIACVPVSDKEHGPGDEGNGGGGGGQITHIH